MKQSALYEKAVAWIVRETRVAQDPNLVAGYRVVNLTAALFDKSPREVAIDVVEFAIAIEGEQGTRTWQK